MKVTSVIILLLVSKATASFYDDFTGAMWSVENAFGKLLNDVVSDVKTTMHCTIFAMEQVLAMHGVIREPSASKQCNEDDSNNIDIKAKKGVRNFISAKDIVQDLSSSIAKVNKTLSHVLDNNGHERLEDVKRTLRNETNRLTEVSFLLRQELEKISQRMNKEFQNVDLDTDKSSLDSIWKNMKKLYEVEKNDKNSSEEISEVLNKALNVLHINTISEVKSDEDKIKVIMRELQQSTNNATNNTINRELSQWNVEQSSLENNLGHKVSEVIPETLKDAATNVININDKIVEKVDDYITDTSDSFVNTTSLNSNVQTENDEAMSSNVDSYDSFPLGEADSSAIDEAIDIIKNSGQTEAILDKLLATEQGTDIFENLSDFKE